MMPDVEIRNLVDASGGFAYLSVRQLRDISGKARMGRYVADLISEDIFGAVLYHLPVKIPHDQNRFVLVWYSDPDEQADAPISDAAPYLDEILELATRGNDLDEATVQRLAKHTERVVAAKVERRVAPEASGERS
ncbi:hypothetical protein ACWCQN_37935 [Streptomyces sp. NPDC001984]